MLSIVRRKLGIISLFLIGVLCGSLLTGVALANQPHMASALNALQTAQSELQQATPDKGGYRENALNLVGQAIADVHKGMHFANTH